MANVTAKTSSNIFYKARCEAATHNEQLSSREGAADYMSIDRGRLYRIESGIAVPYPEEIRLMADLYNAPELENYYCRTMCPLGSEIPKAELADMDRITIRTLSTFRKIGETKEMLLDITEDGVIDENEKPQLEEILKNLEEVEEIAQSMKLWIKKNL
jgi:transcriptional regulator with XRE-family HTH domain